MSLVLCALYFVRRCEVVVENGPRIVSCYFV